MTPLVCKIVAVAVGSKVPPAHCKAQSGVPLPVLVSIGQFQVTPSSVQSAVRRWTSTSLPAPQLLLLSSMNSSRVAD
jgi:hypothetical protein